MVLDPFVPTSGDLLGEPVGLVHDPAQKILHLLLIALPVVQQTKELVTSERGEGEGERERERERERKREKEKGGRGERERQ